MNQRVDLNVYSLYNILHDFSIEQFCCGTMMLFFRNCELKSDKAGFLLFALYETSFMQIGKFKVYETKTSLHFLLLPG